MRYDIKCNTMTFMIHMIHVNSHIQQKYIVSSVIPFLIPFNAAKYAAFIRHSFAKFYRFKITCSFLHLIRNIFCSLFAPVLSYIIFLCFYHFYYVFSFVTINYLLYVFWHPQTIIILNRQVSYDKM